MTEQFRMYPCQTERLVRLETGAIDIAHYHRRAIAMRRAETSRLLSRLSRIIGYAFGARGQSSSRASAKQFREAM